MNPSGFRRILSEEEKIERENPSGFRRTSAIEEEDPELDVISQINHRVTHSAYGGAFGNGRTQLEIYSTSYNILRIMSGMTGLAYSN